MEKILRDLRKIREKVEVIAGEIQENNNALGYFEELYGGEAEDNLVNVVLDYLANGIK